MMFLSLSLRCSVEARLVESERKGQLFLSLILLFRNESRLDGTEFEFRRFFSFSFPTTQPIIFSFLLNRHNPKLHSGFGEYAMTSVAARLLEKLAVRIAVELCIRLCSHLVIFWFRFVWHTTKQFFS
jgi:hypothetical protein